MNDAQDVGSVSSQAETTRTPHLTVESTGWVHQFSSSLDVLLRGPASPKKFDADVCFRDCWIDQRFPKVAFLAAVTVQVLLILFPPPIWNIRPSRVIPSAPRMELTWYGPAKDFPLVLPATKSPKSGIAHDASKTPPHRQVDAFHPRQTILSTPLHPNHPHQTLIRPAAPQEPPKILPSLPNIVQLAGSQPARPKLQLTAEQLAAMRPKLPARRTAPNAAAPDVSPDVSAQEQQSGAITIASSLQAPPKPVLALKPMSAPHAATQKGEANSPPPDIAGLKGANNTLIALSAAPSPSAPPPDVPAGNLSAHVSISPDGPQPNARGAGDAAPKTNGERSDNAGGAHGPDGIFITGGNNANPSPTSSLGIGSASRGVGNPLPSNPVSRARIPRGDSKSLSSEAASTPKLGMAAESVLGAKRVYTLHVNMPNLTSASGSWVLNFAELDETDASSNPGLNQRLNSKFDTSELAGPVPLRKVDPKYPPELRTAHVDGEVILYAIIRKDGSVDSIQLVHSADPQLDVNAMDALAQWKFSPAEKRGEPVDLEAVVHIPFRSSTTGF